MNDKAASAFDPAAAGWSPQQGAAAFPTHVGPIWVREVDDGIRLGLLVENKHLNRANNVHGGMLMTFADQSMALAARRATGGKRHATIELNIQFVGAVKLGEFVVARPEVVRVTRSVIFMRATMYVGKRVVVSTNGIWKILEE